MTQMCCGCGSVSQTQKCVWARITASGERGLTLVFTRGTYQCSVSCVSASRVACGACRLAAGAVCGSHGHVNNSADDWPRGQVSGDFGSYFSDTTDFTQ